MTRVIPSVAVIGGGFTGACFALHLAERAAGPLALHVIEPRAELGRGVAYDSDEPAHRINVPSTRMSIYPGDESHFDRWLRASGAVADDPDAVLVDGRIFPRRAVFGRYATESLYTALARRPAVAFSHHRTRAVGVTPLADGYRIALEDGTGIEADLVVLATSHPPPGPPAELAVLTGTPGYVPDPWAAGALDAVGLDDRVVIAGTGLTMADIVAALALRGHRGPVTVVSRRGLFSRGHPDRPVEPWGRFDVPPPATALSLLRHIRAELAAASAAGEPWQAVLDAVRRDAQALWAALPVRQRARLLRHLRPFWDVHRYRIAPQVEAAVKRAIEEGRLTRRLGRLVGAHAGPGGLVAEIRRGRDSAAIETDALILATGPAHGRVIEDNPALASLAAAGLVKADSLGLGIATDRSSRAIAEDGRASDTLLVAGPLARATFGELMGLPQVSAHAEQVAIRVAAWLTAAAGRRGLVQAHAHIS